MNIKLLLFATVLGLQSAWILGTTYVQEHALASHDVICLETQLVDPRDLIRGDYLILNYKISDLNRTLFSPALSTNPTPGQVVYVALQSNGQFYLPVQASLEPIPPSVGRVILKGKVQSWWGDPERQPIHVAYGLEQYFVREGTGAPHGKLTVNVAVPASGQATIKEVLLDGKPYAEAMREQRK